MRTIGFEMNIPKILLAKALRPLWPGVVYSSLSATRMIELPDPPLPGDNWVCVRNRMCGICATDLHLLFVKADPQLATALPGADPMYLGHEIVGEVAEVGSGVTSMGVGDRVILGNTWQGGTCRNQELQELCPHCVQGNPALCENAYLGTGARQTGGGWGDSFVVHATDLLPVPDGLNDETAALIEPMMVGVRTVLRHLPRTGEKALVVGSGMIGLVVVQALAALSPDCHITAMARYPQQVEMARQFGASEIIAGDESYDEVAHFTDGKLYEGMFGNRVIIGGFDVVYDCVGSPKTMRDSLRWARAGGTVVMTGVHLAPMKVDLSPVWHQEVNLVGTMVQGMETWQGTVRSTFDITCELLTEGGLTAKSLITHRYPLERWREAVRTAADKRSGAIKVAFDYR